MRRRKPLTTDNRIQILEMLKNCTSRETSIKTGFSKTTINNYRRKYRADTPEIIDRVIKQLITDDTSEKANYERQAKCSHLHLFVKCPHCGLTLSEMNKKQIMEILSKFPDENEKVMFEQTI